MSLKKPLIQKIQGTPNKKTAQPLKFVQMQVLGKGTYGEAVLGKIGDDLVVKKISINNPSNREAMIKEIKVLNYIRETGHCNSYFTCLVGKYKNNKPYSHSNTIYFYIKYIENTTTIYSYIVNNFSNIIKKRANVHPETDIDERIVIVYAVLKAISALHNINVVHYDLKPENLLLHVNENKEFGVKIIDFGLSCIGNDITCMEDIKYLSFVGYYPPEIYRLKNNDSTDLIIPVKIDSFMTGITLFNVLFNENIFSSSVDKFTLDYPKKIEKMKETIDLYMIKYKFMGKNAEVLKDIVLNLINLNVIERWTVKEALEYFKKNIVNFSMIDNHIMKVLMNMKIDNPVILKELCKGCRKTGYPDWYRFMSKRIEN